MKKGIQNVECRSEAEFGGQRLSVMSSAFGFLILPVFRLQLEACSGFHVCQPVPICRDFRFAVSRPGCLGFLSLDGAEGL